MTSIFSNSDICFGMTLHNSEKFVASAFESLLGQSYDRFHIIAVDDCSTDATGDITKQFASVDNRITYIKNDSRLGMIMNWRKAFFEAKKRKAKYFAWASDHDLWDPYWLQSHVDVLDAYPEVILAYPLKLSIDAKGKPIPLLPTRFETFGMSKMDRIRATCTKMAGAGNMIYGLFRADILDQCGVFPYFSLPDRLLLMQLSAKGTFKQINKYLWQRRYLADDTGSLFPDYKQLISRHRFTLFLNYHLPWHSKVPTLAQALGIIKQSSLKPGVENSTSMLLACYMAYLHLRTKKRHLKSDLLSVIKALIPKRLFI